MNANKTITIRSSASDSRLVLNDFTGNYYHAELQGIRYRGSRSVYAYEREMTLVAFFHSMAGEWSGWDGAKKWSSLEGELSFSATIDKLGHITLEVVLDENEQIDRWSIDASIQIDAGQLEEIAHNIKCFFEN